MIPSGSVLLGSSGDPASAGETPQSSVPVIDEGPHFLFEDEVIESFGSDEEQVVLENSRQLGMGNFYHSYMENLKTYNRHQRRRLAKTMGIVVPVHPDRQRIRKVEPWTP